MKAKNDGERFGDVVGIYPFTVKNVFAILKYIFFGALIIDYGYGISFSLQAFTSACIRWVPPFFTKMCREQRSPCGA